MLYSQQSVHDTYGHLTSITLQNTCDDNVSRSNSEFNNRFSNFCRDNSDVELTITVCDSYKICTHAVVRVVRVVGTSGACGACSANAN
jgi:hypothetical protein